MHTYVPVGVYSSNFVMVYRKQVTEMAVLMAY